MDVNGGTKPNSETVDNKMHDIRSFNLAKIKGCAGFEITGVGCVINIGNNYESETDSNKSDYITWFDEGCPGKVSWCEDADNRNDYWVGAKNKCISLGMRLTTPQELRDIYAQKGIVDNVPSSGTFWADSQGNIRTAGHKIFSTGSEVNISYKYTKEKVLCVGD